MKVNEANAERMATDRRHWFNEPVPVGRAEGILANEGPGRLERRGEADSARAIAVGAGRFRAHGGEEARGPWLCKQRQAGRRHARSSARDAARRPEERPDRRKAPTPSETRLGTAAAVPRLGAMGDRQTGSLGGRTRGSGIDRRVLRDPVAGPALDAAAEAKTGRAGATRSER